MMKVLSVLLLCSALSMPAADKNARDPLAPKGKIHIPIGIPNAVDSLKTFVEAEGSFSPGFGTYGVYFWLEDDQKQLVAPTMEGIPSEHGLAGGGLLIPWSKWAWREIEVRSELCQVETESPKGKLQVVASRVQVKNASQATRNVQLWVALRPIGPAGGPVREVIVPNFAADYVEADGYPAIVAEEPAATQTARLSRQFSQIPEEACGGMRYDFTLAPGQQKTLKFKFPVLPGRRAVGHRWDGVSTWAQFDLNKPNPSEGGVLQPNPGLAFYRSLKTDALFQQASNYWRNFTGKVQLELPDRRWSEAFTAILEHSAICMNEGAPDVSVVNYNVFNRDGVYIASILQKAGQFALAAQAIDYFLSHPFNGRVQCEADNPGQILWILGEHWKFTRDRQWLWRVFPSAEKIAAMIRYYRTAPGPHYVSPTSLDFGDALQNAPKRQILKPGSCDGFHPEYTEAFDIAGLRAASILAEAIGETSKREEWSKLAGELFQRYDQKFGSKLPNQYGSYSVLWPCRLYPLNAGKAFEQFKNVGAQKPTSWRYFPLATAHQGLLTGNRVAGWQTLQFHLEHPQMRGWYAFDEGGDSGAGGWNHALTTWRQGKVSDAMPHGWAIAEFHLLLCDSLVFEDEDKLVLLSGVPPEWFSKSLRIRDMPTHFGNCSLSLTPEGQTTRLEVSGNPPAGFVLRLPATWRVAAWRAPLAGQDLRLPPGQNSVVLVPRTP